jgi:hypothetical protein
MERYTAMNPQGQPGLPDDPVTAYVNNLRCRLWVYDNSEGADHATA